MYVEYINTAQIQYEKNKQTKRKAGSQKIPQA